ncbi:cytochrome c oxidase, subunit VIa, partial [Paraphysoderma sedebokerense]
SGDLWRKISIFVGVPSLVLAVVNGYLLFRQHEEHLDHDERKFVPYPYLRIRNKPFPWGEETVFFNPRYNLKPEDE